MVEFYRETEFKETEVGKVPIDWEVVKLGGICDFKRGFSYRSSQITKEPTSIRFITINDIKKEGGLKKGAEKIYLKDDVNVEPDLFLNEGDILIANTDMSKGFIIGAPILIKGLHEQDKRLVYSMDLTKLVFDENTVNSTFLFYLLTYKPVRQKMKSFAQGTNVLHLNHKLAMNLKIPFPPLEEQGLIAGILYSMDEAIRAVDASIAKYERLKRGLMQELLTKGIGHKEFREETEIGKIPREWEVIKLRDIILEAKPGFACGKRDENGIIQLRMDSIKTDGWINTEAFVKIPLPDNVDNYLLKPGDILFVNTSGSYDLIGKTALFRGEFAKCVYSNHLTRIRVREEITSSTWVFYTLMRLWQKGLFKALCNVQAGGQKNVKTSTLLNICIPLPPLEEQRYIAEILSSVDKVIEEKKRKKRRLERMKKAITDLLLTGKVRVRA
ncbi:MAG: hypothetical protein DRN90_07875 [Thermoproteota archaeon]|nr:MAG: hypothetical protein DRN90_07875 [Candidatus Korarchaeota archaeon]